MNLRKQGCALLFLLFIYFSSNAQDVYSKVKVPLPSTIQERNNLLGLLEIDHFYIQDGGIISEVSNRVLNKLIAAKVSYQVLVADVAKNLKEENDRYYTKQREAKLLGGRVAVEQTGSTLDDMIKPPTAFVVQPTFGGYYNYAQMSAAIDNLVTAYPGLVQKISIGKSYEQRDIWAVKISDNVTTDETDEPEVLYTGLQHAREAIGGSSLIFFMQYLLENYATSTSIQNLVDNRELFIIPCVNPDGWEYNRTLNANGGGGWRKNRSKVDSVVPKHGATTYEYGVDLNRNYGIDWGNCTGASTACGSNITSDETYYGDNAFSEPETQAIKNFVITHHFVTSIDQHSFGPYYSLPYGRPSLHPALSTADKKFYTFVPALMGTYNGMRAGNSPESVNYEVAGGIKDWLLMGEIGNGTKGKIYGMTGEGGAGGGTGGSYGSFWAPASQIVNLSQGMCFQDLQLAYAAGSYVNMQDVSDMVVSATTGTFNFKITRVGLGDKPVTISMIPVENILTAGTSVTVNSLPNYYDTYSGGISYSLPSAITNGQRIRFVWKVETGGYSYTDTITKFYNPLVLFSDDMEGTSVGTNWTVSAGWNYATDDKYAGSKALTESPGGNYGTSANLTATYTGTFNLSNATAAYLTFWTKHRAENFRDKLQVQLSKDGTTWVAISGSTTVKEPGILDGSTINGEPSLTGIREDWTPELFDLSSFKGNANVKLRFAFTSDADGGTFTYEKDDGFYIDNLSVVKSTAPIVTLPVQIVNFYGKMLPDATAQLNWDAATNEGHDHFEIERSVDGVTFNTIGKMTATPPYQFIDKVPFAGTNFYRIKQIDKDGKVLYSKVISLYLQSNYTVTMYPNPAGNHIKIRWTAAHPQTVRLQITDLQGRLVYQQNDVKEQTENNLEVDTHSWKAQLYILKILNAQNVVISTQRITKM